MNFKLQDFRHLSSGKYNAGNLTVDVKNGEQVLKIANNHVHKLSKNTTPIDLQQAVELKKAFVNALAEHHVSADELDRVRAELGLLPEGCDAVAGDLTQTFLANRFRPLMREQVRDIISRYVDQQTLPSEKASIISARTLVNESILQQIGNTTETLACRCVQRLNREEFLETAMPLVKETGGADYLARLLVALNQLALPGAAGETRFPLDPGPGAAATDRMAMVLSREERGVKLTLQINGVSVGLSRLDGEALSDLRGRLVYLLSSNTMPQLDRQALWSSLFDALTGIYAEGDAETADAVSREVLQPILSDLSAQQMVPDGWHTLPAGEFNAFPLPLLLICVDSAICRDVLVSPADLRARMQALEQNGVKQLFSHLEAVALGEADGDEPLPELPEADPLPPPPEPPAVQPPLPADLPRFDATDTEGTVAFAAKLLDVCRGTPANELPGALVALFRGNESAFLKFLQHPALAHTDPDNAPDAVFLSEKTLTKLARLICSDLSALKTEDDLAALLRHLEETPQLLAKCAVLVKNERSPAMRRLLGDFGLERVKENLSDLQPSKMSPSIAGFKPDAPAGAAHAKRPTEAPVRSDETAFIGKMQHLAEPYVFTGEEKTAPSRLNALVSSLASAASELQLGLPGEALQALFAPENTEALLALLADPAAGTCDRFTAPRLTALLQRVLDLLATECEVPLPIEGNVLNLKLLNNLQAAALCKTLERISAGTLAPAAADKLAALRIQLVREQHVDPAANLKTNLSRITKDLLTEDGGSAALLKAIAAPERLAALLYVRHHPQEANLQPALLKTVFLEALTQEYDAIAAVCGDLFPANLQDLTLGQLQDLGAILTQRVQDDAAFEEKLLAARDAMVQQAAAISQTFVNTALKLDPGVSVKSHYEGMSAREISTYLSNPKLSLKDLLNAPPGTDEPGQAAFTNRVLCTYYIRGNAAEQRLALRNCIEEFEMLEAAGIAPAPGIQEQKVYLIGLFKGSGPLLQKMIQGLDKNQYGDYGEVFDVVKSSTGAALPSAELKTRFQQVVSDSHGELTEFLSARLLGSASVGQTYLCDFKGKDGSVIQVVVKLMRPGVEARGRREAEVFTKAAAEIPGMATFWNAQYQQILDEFDFTIEAANTQAGAVTYSDPKLKLSSTCVDSRVPLSKDVLGLNLAPGKPLDKQITEDRAAARKLYGKVFSVDETGRYKALNAVPQLKVAEQNLDPVLFAELYFSSAAAVRTATSGAAVRLASDFHHVAVKWLQEVFFNQGFFHNDIHTGNIMTDRLATTGANRMTLIDYGNAKSLDISERGAALCMLFGSSFQMNDIFQKGFTNYCALNPKSREFLAEPKNKAKVDAIISAVLAKGKAVSGAGARMLIILQELRRLGMPLPESLCQLTACLSRLQTSINELNGEVLRNAALNKRLVEQDPKVKMPPREKTDVFARLMDARRSKDALKKSVFSDAPFAKTVKSILSDIKKPAFLQEIRAFDTPAFTAYISNLLAISRYGSAPNTKEGDRSDQACDLMRSDLELFLKFPVDAPAYPAMKEKILGKLRDFLTLTVTRLSETMSLPVLDATYLAANKNLHTLEDDFGHVVGVNLELCKNDIQALMRKFNLDVNISRFQAATIIAKSAFTGNNGEGETGALQVQF